VCKETNAKSGPESGQGITLIHTSLALYYHVEIQTLFNKVTQGLRRIQAWVGPSLLPSDDLKLVSKDLPMHRSAKLTEKHQLCITPGELSQPGIPLNCSSQRLLGILRSAKKAVWICSCAGAHEIHSIFVYFLTANLELPLKPRGASGILPRN
jgi:hypothetical protein